MENVLLLIASCIDSASCAATSRCSNCCTLGGWFDLSLSLGEVLTIICAIISVIVAINQFEKSSEETRKLAMQNQRETWFLNVIVLPQLEPINGFYKDVLKWLSDDKSVVQSLGEIGHQQYVEKLAKLKNDRKQQINDFFDQISALVKSYDNTLGKKVDLIIMQLEDAYVTIIDSYGENNEVNEREIILNNKQNLIKYLNKGISKVK